MKVAATTPDAWTEDRIRAQGLQMNSVDAVMAVFNVGRTKAKEVLRSGTKLPFPVLRLGRRSVTPTAHVLRVLGVGEDAPSEASDSDTAA